MFFPTILTLKSDYFPGKSLADSFLAHGQSAFCETGSTHALTSNHCQEEEKEEEEEGGEGRGEEEGRRGKGEEQRRGGRGGKKTRISRTAKTVKTSCTNGLSERIKTCIWNFNVEIRCKVAALKTKQGVGGLL
jgi:hypothetical protein